MLLRYKNIQTCRSHSLTKWQSRKDWVGLQVRDQVKWLTHDSWIQGPDSFCLMWYFSFSEVLLCATGTQWPVIWRTTLFWTLLFLSFYYSFYFSSPSSSLFFPLPPPTAVFISPLPSSQLPHFSLFIITSCPCFLFFINLSPPFLFCIHLSLSLWPLRLSHQSLMTHRANNTS